ncbi:hypothetical protein KKG48_02500 [Patescibacteria group bacterium]|nr:hypothetical protein [Patescibacteria group bacterium]MCG2694976.1 hypothetical protein [Candidatus Parcubacteria bacterium]
MNNKNDKKEIIKKISVKKVVLATVATVGLIGVAVLAPNALQVYRQFYGKKKYKKSDEERNINKAINSLSNRNLIEFEKKGDLTFVKLTDKGEKELLKYELGDLKIKKPKKWDKKWRVIIFDIKEKRRGTRGLLRKALNRLGFVKLQNSVWVFPYDCEELIIMLKSNLFIGKDVLYLTVEKIENDKWLKEVFGLN